MSAYLVTWELNKEKPNYAQARTRFVSRLDQYEGIKDPGLDSVRFISTDWTVDEVDEDLRKHLDNNDRLMVVRLSDGNNRNHQGWLGKDIWEWINSRI